ncbi:MAG: DEAD/DEAH box helicase [Armatimonadetes bacterium]|nr:DEAD/DEAH box helicase [Armatimonadota bacterium]
MKSGFLALGVSDDVCSRLRVKNIIDPTPIQAGAIPLGMQGKDLIGLAQTGTGKTLAFGLPITERLATGQVALILAPTRELAHQIAETLDLLGLRRVLVVGGESMHMQVKQLRKPHEVVIATPGRLMDHMQQRTYKLNRISIVVLDEADRMLDMGFAPAIEKIIAACPKKRQTLLFSATMPPEIESLANKFLTNPERVEVVPPGTASDLVDQELIVLPHEEKFPELCRILRRTEGTVLVFTRTRHGARKLAKRLRTDEGETAAEIHADRTLAQRREALGGFKSGKYRVLVATDVASRGIDVKDISLVVNFDIPEVAEDYIHRIGRTGRAGARGKAITLAIPAQRKLVRAIEKLVGDALVLGKPSKETAKVMKAIAKKEPERPGKERFYKGTKSQLSHSVHHKDKVKKAAKRKRKARRK